MLFCFNCFINIDKLFINGLNSTNSTNFNNVLSEIYLHLFLYLNMLFLVFFLYAVVNENL